MSVEQGDGTRCTAAIDPGTRRLVVRCVAADGTQRWQRDLDAAGDTAVTAQDLDRLYVVSYPINAAGCRVVAMSGADGTILWERAVDGPRPTLHSKYGNEVRVVATGDGVCVEGRESGGSYRELLDPVTGSTVSRVAEPL